MKNKYTKTYFYENHVFMKIVSKNKGTSSIVRRPSSVVRHSSVVRRPSFVRPSSVVRRRPSYVVVRRPSSVVRRPSYVVRRPSSVVVKKKGIQM